VGDRAVIPVARVRLMGGFGFGHNERADRPGEGGGGGGIAGARPAGFIDVGPEGARYEAIPREHGRVAAIAAGVAAGALAGTAVAGTVLGARAITRVGRAVLPAAKRLRSPRRLLRR
jgi:hypothetical protein